MFVCGAHADLVQTTVVTTTVSTTTTTLPTTSSTGQCFPYAVLVCTVMQATTPFGFAISVGILNAFFFAITLLQQMLPKNVQIGVSVVTKDGPRNAHGLNVQAVANAQVKIPLLRKSLI